MGNEIEIEIEITGLDIAGEKLFSFEYLDDQPSSERGGAMGRRGPRGPMVLADFFPAHLRLRHSLSGIKKEEDFFFICLFFRPSY